MYCITTSGAKKWGSFLRLGAHANLSDCETSAMWEGSLFGMRYYTRLSPLDLRVLQRTW